MHWHVVCNGPAPELSSMSSPSLVLTAPQRPAFKVTGSPFLISNQWVRMSALSSESSCKSKASPMMLGNRGSSCEGACFPQCSCPRLQRVAQLPVPVQGEQAASAMGIKRDSNMFGFLRRPQLMPRLADERDALLLGQLRASAASC